MYQGATPVFADVSPDTLNLNPEKFAERITPKTRAVFPVDYAGHPADLTVILEIARKHGLIVIEDACHALGAEHNGARVGSIADMTVFSFHPVKHITTGEGGMVTTNNPHFAETLRRFRNHGISSDARQRQSGGQWYYEMVLLGFNYRLPDIVCALGLQQLKKLESNLARRRGSLIATPRFFVTCSELFRLRYGLRSIRPGICIQFDWICRNWLLTEHKFSVRCVQKISE